MVRKRSNRKILSKRLSRKQRRLTKTKKYKRLSRKSKRQTKRIYKKRLSRKSKRSKKKNKKEKINKRGGMLAMLEYGNEDAEGEEGKCVGKKCVFKKVPEASFQAVGEGTLATTGEEYALMEMRQGTTEEDEKRAAKYLEKVAPAPEQEPAQAQAPAQAPASASEDASSLKLTPEQEEFKSAVNGKLGIIFKESEWLNKLREYHYLLRKEQFSDIEGSGGDTLEHTIGQIIYSPRIYDLYRIQDSLRSGVLRWIDLIEGIEKDKKLLDAVKKYEEMLDVDDEDPKKNELKTESYSFVMRDGTIQTFHDLISKSGQLRKKKDQARKMIDHFDEIILLLNDRGNLETFLSKRIEVKSTDGNSKSVPWMGEVARDQFLRITDQINISIPIDMLFELLRETKDDKRKLKLIKKIREKGFPILDLFTLLKKLNKVQELFDKLPPESREGTKASRIQNDNFLDELMDELSDFLNSKTANDALLEERKSGLEQFIKDSIDKTGLLIYLKDFDKLSEKFDKLIEKYEGFIKKKNMITYEVQLEGAAVPLEGEILNHNFNNLNNVINRIIILIEQMNRLSIKPPDSVKVTYEGIPEQEIKGSDSEEYKDIKDIKDKSFKINFESEVL